MTPYFADTARAAALRAAMAADEGRMFLPWSCDCFSWPLGRFLTAAPHVSAPPVPRYPIRGVTAYWRDTLHAALMSIDGMTVADITAPRMTGDILFFSLGDHWQHLGLVDDGPRFWHALPRYGVHPSDLRDDTWSRRLWQVYRLYETGAD